FYTSEAWHQQELNAAFQRAADLSQYSPESLEAVTEWVLLLDSDEAAQSVAQALGPQVTLGAIPLVDNVYSFTAPASLPYTSIIDQLQTRSDVDAFYPLVA